MHFTGYCDNVRPAVARAHVVLSSARTEGLGIALLEAMAMGRPVVALPTGGIPEFVEDGVTGWLAEGPGADALARALKRVLAEASDLRRRGQKARERVVSQYSVEAMRQGYERLYARLDTR